MPVDQPPAIVMPDFEPYMLKRQCYEIAAYKGLMADSVSICVIAFVDKRTGCTWIQMDRGTPVKYYCPNKKDE